MGNSFHFSAPANDITHLFPLYLFRLPATAFFEGTGLDIEVENIFCRRADGRGLHGCHEKRRLRSGNFPTRISPRDC